MDIHIPASIGLILLGLSLVALLFIGYQLDDLYRRIKEIESFEEHELRNSEQQTQNILVMLSDRITFLEKQLQSKPKGKVGRPRKVKNGKNDNP